ncbi:MAG TPA: photosynthetic reaction center cytochrome PufC [Polyangiaceae bacterium LLY-WYZ-14_1]|jgi:photosynthetic reaction center cytochrome c subunit|nr:photosynthetic reaction center cytochrome PufC [Polyangiaceae bacterium LLY-WYZ-14_1]
MIRQAAFALLGVLFLIGAVAAYRATATAEIGYAGVGMQVTDSEKALIEKAEYNALPPALPAPSEGGPLAVDAYENVQVLGHLTAAQFTRLMTAITLWVSPEQGCAYCHNTNNMASDEVYAKHVARKMIYQTWHLNENWQEHVQQTGVTCYTCHRGNPVPEYVWTEQPEQASVGMLGYTARQNAPAGQAGLASLPGNAFETYLLDDQNIRVQTNQPLPNGNRSSTKSTEWTYALMMHFSTSLGVNCTYCHNSRSWAAWEQSPVTRATAWYGIRMVRDLNNNHIMPIRDLLPAHRLGANGDVPKANCATCHQGAYKPFLGQSMLDDYPSLRRSMPQPEKYVIEVTDDRVVAPKPIEFETDSSAISGDSYRLVSAVAKAIQESDDIAAIQIVGHTDVTGDPAQNRALSQRRAEAVKTFLADRGVEVEMTTYGAGDTQRVCTEDTADCHERNRRVEFLIAEPGAPSPLPPVQTEGEGEGEAVDGEAAGAGAPAPTAGDN